VVRLTANSVTRICRYLFAFDVQARVPAFSDREGYGVFSALATFALAQGAALTAVAKEEDKTWIVLSIYFVTVVATIWWIRSMLAAVKEQRPYAHPRFIRAFDYTSIRYGRWAQGWTIFLSVVLFILGCLGLLPNQTSRAFYNKGDADCDAWIASDRLQLDSNSERLMDQWIRWIGNSGRDDKREKFVWIQTKGTFEQSYKPFNLELRCTSEYEFGERVAFLVKQEREEYRPTYRQIRFREAGFSTTNAATLEVPDANRGERIVVLVFARDPNHEEQPTAQQFKFKLYAPFSGAAK
jgi:hypothetical protein